MLTQKFVDHLSQLDIPSFSISGAIVELGQQELSLNQTLEQIESLTNTKPNVLDVHEARLMYHYLIQDGLRLRKQGVENVDTNWILDTSLNKAKEFKRKYPYVFATGEDSKLKVATVVGEKSVKQKKGWKLARAKELIKANPNMDRKEMIQLFTKELEMSQAAATTYFYNLVKKK